MVYNNCGDTLSRICPISESDALNLDGACPRTGTAQTIHRRFRSTSGTAVTGRLYKQNRLIVLIFPL